MVGIPVPIADQVASEYKRNEPINEKPGEILVTIRAKNWVRIRNMLLLLLLLLLLNVAVADTVVVYDVGVTLHTDIHFSRVFHSFGLSV